MNAAGAYGNTRSKRLLGLGELLWDIVGDEKRPGGAPANVAFHAAQLGLSSTICSRVGTDPLGDELVDLLAGRGLNTSLIQRDPAHPTSTVTVTFEREDHPTYAIHTGVAWDHLEFGREWAAGFASADAVCFGTLAQRSPESRTAIQRALQAAPGALRVLDVNLRAPHFEREIVKQSLRHANIVKLNQDEVEQLSALFGWSPATPSAFARHCAEQFGIGRTCVTRGAAGCLLYEDGREYAAPAARLQLVDPVGAGDAFTAGLTYALLAGWSPEMAGRFANRVGGLVANRKGAMPVLTEEFARLKQEFPAGG